MVILIYKRVVIILLIAGVSCSLNLIKNGDFQVYQGINWNSFPILYNGKYFWLSYYSISSNISEWYDRSMGQIQLQKLTTENTTIVVDMSSSIPMTLCQNVSLTIGSKYNLSFDMYTSLRIQNMLGRAYLNGNLLTQISIPTNCTFATKKYSFFADRNQNNLCFNETHTGASPYPYYINVGGVIDNVSLYLVEKQHLMFKYTLKQLQNSLFLEGNVTFTQDLAHEIAARYNLLINDRPVSYEIKQSDAGTFLIEIKQNYSFDLESVKLVEKQNYIKTSNSTFLEISLSLPRKKKYFFYLRQNQVQILKKSKQVLFFINNILSNISALSQIFFFAYFINMIIDMQFLSLFYVFTQIKVIPDFTRKIYHEILRIVFSTKSLIQYLADLLKISFEFLSITFQNSLPERNENLKNEQPWFGYYYTSSRVIQSNLSNFFVLIWSCVKLGLLSLILKLITICFPSLLKIKVNFISQVLTQFCFMVPIFLISTQANIISSVENYGQRGYKVGCLIFMKICLMLLFLYAYFPTFTKNHRRIVPKKIQKEKLNFPLKKQNILQNREESKSKEPKTKKLKNVQKKQQKIKKKGNKAEEIKNQKLMKINIKYNQQAFSILLFFFIPLMSLIFNPPLFLMINTFSVILRFSGFFKQRHQKGFLIEHIINFLIGLVWLIHHIAFVLFFFFQDQDLNENGFFFIICLGITAVFTVAAIIILKAFKLLILIIKFFKQGIKFFRKKNSIRQGKNKPQNKIEREQRQENKEYISQQQNQNKQLNDNERKILENNFVEKIKIKAKVNRLKSKFTQKQKGKQKQKQKQKTKTKAKTKMKQKTKVEKLFMKK